VVELSVVCSVGWGSGVELGVVSMLVGEVPGLTGSEEVSAAGSDSTGGVLMAVVVLLVAGALAEDEGGILVLAAAGSDDGSLLLLGALVGSAVGEAGLDSAAGVDATVSLLELAPEACLRSWMCMLAGLERVMIVARVRTVAGEESHGRSGRHRVMQW
jgi:hypothetical protein